MTKPERDYSETLFLPQTDSRCAPACRRRSRRLLARWQELGLYERLREAAQGRTKFVLHDGPPYANGNIHIGTCAQQDPQGRGDAQPADARATIPITCRAGTATACRSNGRSRREYRAKGKNKDAVPIDRVPPQECRAFARALDRRAARGVQAARRRGRLGASLHDHGFPAEAQIAREIMKFAANGTLYRGSKPVMWTVVEKTALAEAEVEYEDYTSDTVWVKFPVRSQHDDGKLRSSVGRVDRHLDDDALDAPRQPRDQLFVEDRLRPLRGHRRAGGQLGARPAIVLILADKLAAEVFKQARVAGFEKAAVTSRLPMLAQLACAHPLEGVATAIDFAVPLLAGDHVTDEPAPASCTPRPATAARTSTSGPRARASSKRAASTPRSPTRSMRTALSPSSAGLHRQARHQRQGREGRRQRGGDQGAGRGRHADRARPAQAPVSAFLALEEAGDLPQHAAMVHRDGQGHCRGRQRSGDTLAPSRAARRSRRRAGCRPRARTASPA